MRKLLLFESCQKPTTAAPSEARLIQPVFFSLVLPLKTWVLHKRLATHLDTESACNVILTSDAQHFSSKG